MITIDVKNVRCKVHGVLPSNVIEQIDRKLSYRVEGYFFDPRFKRGWSGWEHLFLKSSQTFPTGCLSYVLEILKKNNIQYQIKDLRNKILPTNAIKVKPEYVYRDYQKEAITLAVKNERGTLVLATGSGKSLIIAGFVGYLNLPTIIFVHTKDLLQQMINNLKNYLGITPGQIGDGVVKIRRINVATMQTVMRAFNEKYVAYDYDESDLYEDNTDVSYTKEKIKQLVNDVSCIVIDECHHASCRTLQFITKHCYNARYRLGVSATLREDGDDILVVGVTGRILMRKTASELIDLGYLVPPTIYFYNIPRPTETKNLFGTYPKIYEANIVNNEYRNNLIVRIAKKFRDKNKKVLIFVQRVRHGEILFKKLRDEGIQCEFLEGRVSSQKRQQVLDDFRQNKLEVLVAGKLADEGLDLPILDAIILAGGGRSATKAYQRIGRALRLYPNKEKAYIVDFIDNVKYLNAHSKRRLNLYRQERRFEIKIQS